MNWLLTKLRSYYRSVFPKKSQTIRYTFSLLFLLATVTGFATVIMSGGHMVRLEAPSRVVVDETFEIIVYADAKSAVNAINIQVPLPEDQFELLGINRGNSVLTLWTTDPYIEDGIIYLEGGTFRKGFIGEHQIATLLVRSLTAGKDAIRASSAAFYAGDGSGIEYQVHSLGSVDFVSYVSSEETSDEAHYTKLADLNNDNKITLIDISVFMSAWNNRERLIDFDNDGKMTFTDFSILLSIYFRQNR